jgi:Colicin E5 ribonuclease domain
VAALAFDEPYLPNLLAYFDLLYLTRLVELSNRLDAAKSHKSRRMDDDDEDERVTEAIAKETNRTQLELKQKLDSKRQQAFGIHFYVWQGGECAQCSPKDGQIYEWDEGEEPGDVHPNCACSADPLLDGANQYSDAIEPVYPLESLLGMAGALRGIARVVGGKILQRLARSGRPAPRGGRTNTEWTLGAHKSPTKWENQMRQRGWDKEKITDTIKNGREHAAPNKVNPSNTANRYEKGGKFIVRDDKTKEIIQLGDSGFKPNKL